MFRPFCALAGAVLAAGFPSIAAGQTFETLGTRASGLGGAFVGVADDATAIYWNPAGLASGAYFSLVVDRTVAEIKPDDLQAGSSRSGGMIALAAPPLGLSYYRLRHTTTSPLTPGSGAQPDDGLQVTSLVTHHAGVTFVQSLTDAIAIGGTLKLVRGVAASGIAVEGTRGELLDADELIGRASSTVDGDVGIMASLGVLKAGLTVRNLADAEFEPAGSGPPLELHRQARAGVAFLLLQGWQMAVDVDLTRQPDPTGDTRNVATGVEGQVHRRVSVRGGLRFNTVESSGARTVFSGGGSFAIFGSTFVDAQITGGSEDGDRGWGVAGRVVF